MWTRLRNKAGKYFFRLAVALDQFCNALLFGYPDETLSCRAWREAQAGRVLWKALRLFIDLLFFWQSGHCREAWLSEQRRAHFPSELR